MFFEYLPIKYNVLFYRESYIHTQRYFISLLTLALILPLFQNCSGSLESLNKYSEVSQYGSSFLRNDEKSALADSTSNNSTDQGLSTETNTETNVNAQTEILNNDLKTKLLNLTQPLTGMLSRTGWGMNATGGKNYVTVNNEIDLRKAASKEGNYVVIKTNTKNEVWKLSAPIKPGKNVTIDGSLSNGLKLYNPGGFHSLRVIFSNIIIHNLYLVADPKVQVTAVSIIRGRDIWLNQITLEDFQSDDGIAIGSSNSENNTGYITISNLKSDNSNYGSVSLEVYPKDITHGINGYLTVHNSWLGSRQRTIKNDGGRNVHTFNNLIDGVHYSHMDVGNDNNLSATTEIQTLSESNYFTNQGGKNNCAERAHGGGFIYTDGLSYYEDKYKTCLDVIKGNSGRYPSRADTPPYQYVKLKTNETKIAVMHSAGAKP